MRKKQKNATYANKDKDRSLRREINLNRSIITEPHQIQRYSSINAHQHHSNLTVETKYTF